MKRVRRRNRRHRERKRKRRGQLLKKQLRQLLIDQPPRKERLDIDASRKQMKKEYSLDQLVVQDFAVEALRRLLKQLPLIPQ
jgi:hypothetical protein